MKTEDIKMMQEQFDHVMELLDTIDRCNCDSRVLSDFQLRQFDKAYTALWDIRADLYRDAH